MLIINEEMEKLFKIAINHKNELDQHKAILEMNTSDAILKNAYKKVKDQLRLEARYTNNQRSNRPLDPERIKSECKNLERLNALKKMLENLNVQNY